MPYLPLQVPASFCTQTKCQAKEACVCDTSLYDTYHCERGEHNSKIFGSYFKLIYLVSVLLFELSSYSLKAGNVKDHTNTKFSICTRNSLEFALPSDGFSLYVEDLFAISYIQSF